LNSEIPKGSLEYSFFAVTEVAVVILGNQSICSRTGSENKMEGFPPKIM
jgi:hypothetical protein